MNLILNPFFVIYQIIFGLAHAIFILMTQGQMHCLITHDDAEGLVFLEMAHLHPLTEGTDDKCNMSLKFSCYAFYHHNRYYFITRLDLVLI